MCFCPGLMAILLRGNATWIALEGAVKIPGLSTPRRRGVGILIPLNRAGLEDIVAVGELSEHGMGTGEAGRIGRLRSPQGDLVLGHADHLAVEGRHQPLPVPRFEQVMVPFTEPGRIEGSRDGKTRLVEDEPAEVPDPERSFQADQRHVGVPEQVHGPGNGPHHRGDVLELALGRIRLRIAPRPLQSSAYVVNRSARIGSEGPQRVWSAVAP